MKKTITSLLLMLFALSLSAQNSPLKGDGSSSNPYQIKSIADLKFMSEKVNNGVESYVDKHYKLICDLEFADNADDWTPIGKGFNNPFKGTFDGGGYAIKNINIGSDGSPAPIEFAGLFGRANGATISNLTVAWKGLYVSSSSSSSYYYSCSGGIVSSCSGGSIINCSSSGSISSSSSSSDSSDSYSGGIVGHSFSGVSIINCSSSGSISSSSISSTSYSLSGGIVGCSSGSASIINCSSSGSISSSSSKSSYSGGIVGQLSGGRIINCSSSGSISSSSSSYSYSSSSGGIVGISWSDSESSVENCIALNASITAIGVSDKVYACRILGHFNNDPALENNYAKAGMVVQTGTSEGSLSDVTIDSNNLNHGTNLENKKPVDLLNAWVYEANKTAIIPYLTWTVKEGVNNGYPIFGVNIYQCGDDAFWSYDEGTKTLTIYGTGPMWDFDTQAQPWKSFAYQVAHVKVEEGITYIGASSFNGMKALVSTAFGVTPITERETAPSAAGGSLAEIGHSAFFSCVSLKEVSIPEGVHTVGPMAFFSCSSLPEITIPSTLKYWRAWIFKNCTGLKKVTFSEGVTATGTYTFVGCTSLEEVVLPSTMERLEGFAFQGCKSLNELTIPENVTHIGLQAFENCSGLTKITTLATTPANVLEAAFNGVNKDIPVIVPVGTVPTHQAANGWSEFTNIQDGSTGIENTQGENGFVVDGNNIILDGEQQIEIYSLTGAMVFSGITDRVTVSEAGIYIVKVAGKALKLSVR